METPTCPDGNGQPRGHNITYPDPSVPETDWDSIVSHCYRQVGPRLNIATRGACPRNYTRADPGSLRSLHKEHTMDISTSFSGSYLESWALHALSRDVECGERASVNPASESPANRLLETFGDFRRTTWRRSPVKVSPPRRSTWNPAIFRNQAATQRPEIHHQRPDFHLQSRMKRALPPRGPGRLVSACILKRNSYVRGRRNTVRFSFMDHA